MLEQSNYPSTEPVAQPSQTPPENLAAHLAEQPLAPTMVDDAALGAALVTSEPVLSAVELQHADQPQRDGENVKAEASFARDMAASEAIEHAPVDDILDELSE